MILGIMFNSKAYQVTKMRIFYFLVTVGLADFVNFNVSQEDFDNLVEQVYSLQATVESHEHHIRELKNDNEILASQNENLLERVTRLEVRLSLVDMIVPQSWLSPQGVPWLIRTIASTIVVRPWSIFKDA